MLNITNQNYGNVIFTVSNICFDKMCICYLKVHYNKKIYKKKKKKKKYVAQDEFEDTTGVIRIRKPR